MPFPPVVRIKKLKSTCTSAMRMTHDVLLSSISMTLDDDKHDEMLVTYYNTY